MCNGRPGRRAERHFAQVGGSSLKRQLVLHLAVVCSLGVWSNICSCRRGCCCCKVALVVVVVLVFREEFRSSVFCSSVATHLHNNPHSRLKLELKLKVRVRQQQKQRQQLSISTAPSPGGPIACLLAEKPRLV